MDIFYQPYIDSIIEVFKEKRNPPRVTIDNDTYQECTLVKVDSANKHGMLLEMVQVLTDLDLVILKSYISSDGVWLMDVFHVSDQLGNKITDKNLIHYIEKGICKIKKASKEVTPIIDPEDDEPQEEDKPWHVKKNRTALEMTGIDRPGVISEMSAVLAELGCSVSSAVAWTHNSRAACIIYVEDSSKGGPIEDPCKVAEVQAQLKNVVEAHHYRDERPSVRLAGPAPGQMHTERRLHQLLAADRDYEECCSCCGGVNEEDEIYGYTRCGNVQMKGCDGTHIRIENCKRMGYSIVNVRSRDRPKLLFDTVCTLTDLQYVVYHAAITAEGSLAFQEYYVKHSNGHFIDTEDEKHRVTQCLIAATERRTSNGLRLDICTGNRTGLLSDVTRVFRENGLSITRAEIGIRGEEAVGTFYVKDASGDIEVNPGTLEMVRQEIGGSMVVENKSCDTSPTGTPSRSSTTTSKNKGLEEEEKSKFSLGNLLWTQLERLSINFLSIKS